MADAIVNVIDGVAVVTPFGYDLLAPIVASSESIRAATEALRDEVQGLSDDAADSAAAAATSGDTTYVELEYVAAASWETPNKFFVRPIRNVSLTGALTQYRFRLIAPFENIVGAYQVHIVKYGVTPAADGTIVAGQSVTGSAGVTTGNGGCVAIKAKNGVDSPAIGTIARYALIEFLRNPSPVGTNPGTASEWHLLEPADNVSLNLVKLSAATDGVVGHRASIIRPVGVRRNGPAVYYCDTRLSDARYTNTANRADEDHALYVVRDMGSFQGDANSFTLNSLFARLEGRDWTATNQLFDDLESTILTNQGHVPSIIGNVFMCGKVGDAISPANQSLAGPGHDHEVSVSASAIGRKTDATSGGVPANSADLKAYPMGQIWFGDRMTFTTVNYYQTPANQNAFLATRVLTVSDAGVNENVILDPTVAGVTISPMTVPGGYATMMVLRGRFDRLQTYIRGVAQAPVTINQRSGATITLGAVERVEAYWSKDPLVRQVCVNNAGYSGGASYSHWEDTGGGWTLVPQDGNVIIILQPWGNGKVYFPIYSSQTTGKNMTGIKCKFDYDFFWVDQNT